MAKARKGQPKRAGARPAGPAPASRFALTRRQRRRLGWAAAAVALLVVVGTGGWLYARARGPIPGEFVPSLGNDHIPTSETPHVAYNSDPPTSGPHLPYIAPWGVHARPIAKELQVHNLEDGGVVVELQAPVRGPGPGRDSARSSIAIRTTSSWPRTPRSIGASR